MDTISASLLSIMLTTIFILSVFLLIDIYGSPTVKMSNGHSEYKGELTLAMNMIVRANQQAEHGWELIGAINARPGENVISIFRRPTQMKVVNA